MIFEWYSGSDKSRWVAGRLYEYSLRKDAMKVEDCVAFLRSTLQRETDRNWRGLILYIVGDVLFLSGEESDAIRPFSEAEGEFDPFAANFRDVGEEYCRTLYRLAAHHYLDVDSEERIIDWGTRIIQNLKGPWLDDFEKFMLFNYVGGAFNSLGIRDKAPWCHRVALNYYYSAHHIDPNEPSCLEWIIYCHSNLGELDKCRELYEIFLVVANTYEFRSRVEDFMRTRVGIGPGTSPS